jgi:hypothetical protein
MTKDEFLARIRQERAKLDEVVDRVGESRMEEPALEGGRSVKDVLAHISAWEKIAVGLVRRNEPLKAPPPGENGPSTDAINDKVYQDNRDRPLPDVVAEELQSYASLIALVESMSQAELETPIGGQEHAGQSPPAAAIIGGNSDGHYQEHVEQIERWLGQSQP